jgi:hypothetical protein
MPSRISKINLLPPSELEKSFWGKFLKWAVTTGRYIIILTELVVILAFLSRFKLDEDLRKVNEQINTQVGFLESQEPEMAKFFKLQKRLNFMGQILDQRPKAGEMMDYLQQILPADVYPMTRQFNKSGITLTASTINERAMGQLMTRLSQDQVWKSVNVVEITGDKKYGIRFTLTAEK